MSDALLYHAARDGDLARVQALVEHGVDKDNIGGDYDRTPLFIASWKGNLPVVRYLVEQGANMEKADQNGWNPVINASFSGHLGVVRYLLEQGANRDKADRGGYTPIHFAARQGHLEIAKLLMVYGADLNARNRWGELPIDMGHRNTEEIRQAIRDEPERRWDQQPRKRCVEQQDQYSDAAASISAEEGQSNSKPPAEGEAEDGKIADEDQDSEQSSDEDGN